MYERRHPKEFKSTSSTDTKSQKEETVLAKQLKDLEMSDSHNNASSASAITPAKESAITNIKETKNKLPSKSDEADSLIFRRSAQSVIPQLANIAANDPKMGDTSGGLQEDIDETVKKLFPNCPERDEEIPERFYQKLARVVYIIERRHSRACSGCLKPPSNAVS